MSASKFTEVRTSEGFHYKDVMGIFAFIGFGYFRSEYIKDNSRNAGSPFSFHLRGHKVDGVLPGTVKVTRMRHTTDVTNPWYSLRSIGAGGNGKTVYLRGDTMVAVCNEPVQTLDSLWHNMMD